MSQVMEEFSIVDPPTLTSAQLGSSAQTTAPELSVVMPCLNEADTVGTCVEKAHRAMRDAGIDGEVIVADNGSTDASPEIARTQGAKVVHVQAKGYGNALMGGIAAARGRYILMGDSDDSYDFLELPKFVEKLRAGADIVQGCRLPAGGGTVRRGAMPFLHRWWGNPMFSFLTRFWFRAPIHDVYCGMRGFKRDWYDRLDQHCTGMEFATEMIIKSARYGARFAEVPITLHQDGRKSHPPHLKTFRDGWRTLRFFLMCSPKWLFLQPGKLLVVLGLIGFVLGLTGVSIGRIEFGVNTLIFASMAILCGTQAVLFALGTKTFALRQRLMLPDPRLERFFERVTLERGVIAGCVMLLAGMALLLVVVAQWFQSDFHTPVNILTLRWVISGATLTAWGLQVVLGSFFIGILRMPHR